MPLWNEYHKKTISESPSFILKKFFDMGLDDDINLKTAIDLGCGSGNDTVYLLKHNYSVVAVDKEDDVIEIIKSRIPKNYQLDFIIDMFGGVKLSRTNLVVANFSIPFCHPKYFSRFCKEITNNINLGGYFVGNFLGKEDEWKDNENKTFVSKEDIDTIFEDFDIMYFKEKKYSKKKESTGRMKFWHIYDVIAKKIK